MQGLAQADPGRHIALGDDEEVHREERHSPDGDGEGLPLRRSGHTGAEGQRGSVGQGHVRAVSADGPNVRRSEYADDK